MSDKKKVSFVKKVTSYFKEVKSDIKKIAWPTPKQTLHNTVIVLVSIVVSGAVVSLIDYVFISIANLLTK